MMTKITFKLPTFDVRISMDVKGHKDMAHILFVAISNTINFEQKDVKRTSLFDSFINNNPNYNIVSEGFEAEQKYIISGNNIMCKVNNEIVTETIANFINMELCEDVNSVYWTTIINDTLYTRVLAESLKHYIRNMNAKMIKVGIEPNTTVLDNLTF